MLRHVLGMKQQQLAKRAWTSQCHIVALEKEENDPRLFTLKKVAEALHCGLLVRMVPQEDLEKLLKTKAKQKLSN